eukprot:TRINITY_DN3030_c4_g11_i1.p1 TRINITY_DN3030_c4_g11~~TRINITY_DN3030_c4_g11_i1.p1  ORF type:complete len:339 (-),score=46.40 TRINITY_DN3030_c4_g11_i1:486-1502(-)
MKTIRNMLYPKIDEGNVLEIGDVISDNIYNCKYSLDGKHLLICSYKVVQIIDMETGTLICSLKDHTGGVINVAVSSDGHKLATCSYDKFILIYNLLDFSILHRLRNDTFVYGICFSHCSNYVYSGDKNGNLKKWVVENGNVVMERTVHSGGFWNIKLSADDKHLLTSNVDKTASLFDPENFSVVRVFNQDADIEAIDFHPTKRIIAVGDVSNKVTLWNMDDGSQIHTFDMRGAVYDLHFLTPNIILIMFDDGYISSYSLSSFQQIQKVHCDCDEYIFSFAVSPESRQLACAKCEGDNIKVSQLKLAISRLVSLNSLNCQKTVVLLMESHVSEYNYSNH